VNRCRTSGVRRLVGALLGSALLTSPAWAQQAKQPPPPLDVEILFRAGEYAKALPLYEQRVKAGANPELAAHALFQMGQCLTGLQKYKEAVTRFDAVVKQFPFSTWADDALLRKGCLQAGVLKQGGAAIETWDSLIRQYPRSERIPEARFDTGMIEWLGGRKQAARASWQPLIRDYPWHSFATQAQLYLKEGKP